MKHFNKLITIILMTVFFNTVSAEVRTVNHLQYKDGIHYEINTEKPFTGKLLKKYKNGRKRTEGNYKNGMRQGLATWWHDNGKKEAERNWKDDKQHGVFTLWYHDNGQKMSEVNYKDGNKHGVFTLWHYSGKKKSEECYQNGNKADMTTCTDKRFWFW